MQRLKIRKVEAILKSWKQATLNDLQRLEIKQELERFWHINTVKVGRACKKQEFSKSKIIQIVLKNLYLKINLNRLVLNDLTDWNQLYLQSGSTKELP